MLHRRTCTHRYRTGACFEYVLLSQNLDELLFIHVTAAGPIYIGELSPPHIRGKIMTFWQMFYSVGSFIAYWVNFACGKHIQALGDWDWKMVVIFQLLMPILILCQVFFIPETPRWYVQHGAQFEKARKSLQRVRETDQEVEDELLAVREAIEFEKEAISGSYSALWKDRSVRKRLYLAFIINAGQQITGQGTLNTYSSIVYKKVFKNGSQINLINALNATFGIVSIDFFESDKNLTLT